MRRIAIIDYIGTNNYIGINKSQVSLVEQDELAGKLGEMVMFVRDNKAEKLVSSILDYQ